MTSSHDPKATPLNRITAFARTVGGVPEIQIIADDPTDETLIRSIVEQSPLRDKVERYQREAMAFRVHFRPEVDHRELEQLAGELTRGSAIQ